MIRFRFKFSLSDLMYLTVIIGLMIALISVYRKEHKLVATLEARIEILSSQSSQLNWRVDILERDVLNVKNRLSYDEAWQDFYREGKPQALARICLNLYRNWFGDGPLYQILYDFYWRYLYVDSGPA